VRPAGPLLLRCTPPCVAPRPSQSPEVGRFSEVLAFDVQGGERNVLLPLSGVCDYPHISTDYRNVFYRKVRAGCSPNGSVWQEGPSKRWGDQCD
jgi:hypothetical protein